jgi:hypothetical protein
LLPFKPAEQRRNDQVQRKHARSLRQRGVDAVFGHYGIRDRLQPARLVVEIAQIVLHEGDEPDPLADPRLQLAASDVLDPAAKLPRSWALRMATPKGESPREAGTLSRDERYHARPFTIAAVH